MATITPSFQTSVDRSIAASAARPRVTAPVPEKARTDVVVVSDPAAMMADMAEELGFMMAEALGGADEVEGEADENFADLISELIRESLKAQGCAADQNQQDAKALRDQLVQQAIRGGGQPLEEALRKFTGGSPQKALALMAELAELAKTDPDLQRLGFGRPAVEDYALQHEAGLTAAINIAGVLQSSAPPDSAQRILGLYEDSIASSQSVLQTFQRLGQSEGIASVSDWRKYLTEAVAADLAKQTSGGEKVQLQLILLELKGFRVFNTLSQGLDKLAKIMPKAQGPEAAGLMQSTLDYIEQPLREFPGFEALTRQLPLQRQILFFQGFRNLLKSIPDDAYASPEQKAGTLIPLQKRVDDLTWSEDL